MEAIINEMAENSESEQSEAEDPRDESQNSAELISIIKDDAYLLYEEAEDDTVSAPPHLPTEMLVKIMSMFDASDLLRSTMQVCKRWNLVSKQVILNQVHEIESRVLWYKKDLRAHVPKLPPLAVTKQLANLKRQNEETGITVEFLQQVQNVKLLSFFHHTHFETHHEIGLHCESARDLTEGENGTIQDRSFLRTMRDKVSTDYSLVLMKYHNLILLPSDINLKFFAKPDDSVVTQDSENIPDINAWEEYGISAHVPHPPSSIRGKISVFEDVILATGIARRSIIYIRVEKVDHDRKKVILNFIREIFTPFFVISTLYFNRKIYILYEDSRFVGLWRENLDVLELSDTALAPGANEANWSFYRIGSVIFISMFTPWSDPPRTWKCLDGNQDNLVMLDVEMSTLVQSIQINLRDRAYGNVRKVYSFNNVFIAACHPVAGGAGSSAVAPMMILVAIMKRQPRLEDFASVDAFKSLFFMHRTRTLKLMGSFKSDPFYFMNGINMLGMDDGGVFVLRITKTFISEP